MNTRIFALCALALAVSHAAGDTIFNWSFFEQSPNELETLLPADARYASYVKVIDVPAVAGGRFLEIVMNGEQEEALAFLTRRE